MENCNVTKMIQQHWRVVEKEREIVEQERAVYDSIADKISNLS